MRQAAVAGILAATLGVVSFLIPSKGDAFDKEKRRHVMQGVVFVLAANFDGEKLKPISSGSGTILTPDGAILTNYHVVFDEDRNAVHDVVIIGLTKSFDQDPELTCIAFPKNGALKPDLDLALVKCEVDMQGKPYHPDNWPFVAVGSSEDIVPGDDVYVIGFPGAGGSTINVTAGKVSGFQSNSEGAGRDWIKTDAAITHGNSGGTAVNDDGLFIGVPSAFRFDRTKSGGSIGLIRPIELARELVNLAKNGWNPGSTGGVASRGDGFGGDQKPAPPRSADRAGVTVFSQIVAADNGKPVADAIVVVLKPGVRLKDVKDDFSNIGELLLTKATSHGDGRFIMEDPLPKGQRFGVLVAAKGFQLLSSDGVLSTEGSVPDRYDPWTTIRLQRN